jgi:hypothetical protein
MLEDVSRVIQLELQLLEAKLAPSLMAWPIGRLPV